jgi:transposase
VLRILSGESTITESAKELGVHHTTVGDRVKAYQKDGPHAFPGSGHLTPDQAEIHRLRKQLADLKEENEILKKAAAFFAKHLK